MLVKAVPVVWDSSDPKHVPTFIHMRYACGKRMTLQLQSALVFSVSIQGNLELVFKIHGDASLQW